MPKPSTDDGSALPLLLGALGLLILFTLALLGSAQFLQQQRQLNTKTDAVALHLASLQLAAVKAATMSTRPESNLEAVASADILQLYGNESPIRLRIVSGSSWVQVGYCERARATIGAMIWGGQALVCAQSRAAALGEAGN